MSSFKRRLGFFLFGLILGIIIVRFIFQKKNVEFDYFPNERTLKSIRNKPKFIYTTDVLNKMKEINIDTSDVNKMLMYGKVNFHKSDVKSNPCKTYLIEPTEKTKIFSLKIERCDSIATVVEIKK